MRQKSFNQRFLDFISSNRLIDNTGKLLAAVSGGLDSTVMCDLLYKNKIPFIIAHANFSLRGKDSVDDEKFVKTLSVKYKTEFVTKKFNTAEYAVQNGLSIEMAARELRYNWFYELLAGYNLDKIVTAHHKNDNAETVFLNLIRGTGLHGLHGILPVSGKVIHPMLFATRHEIKEYAEENSIIYRTDKSNDDTDIMRNFIRHKIIPELIKINPQLEETLASHTDYLREYEKFVQSGLDEIKKMLVSTERENIRIDIDLLKKLEHKKLILYEILHGFGFNYETVIKIIESLDKIPGKRFYSPEFQLVKDRNYLIINSVAEEKKNEVFITSDIKNIEFNGKLFKFEKLKRRQKLPDLREKSIAYLDFAKLEFPLKISYWKEGDYFYPFGMKTKKKLSDFFVDRKIPVSEKTNIPVFSSAGKIIWIAGFRTDNRFAINANTIYCFKISVINLN